MKVKMTAAGCNFVSLGDKMRELLDKKGTRKIKREGKKFIDHMIGQKKARIFALSHSHCLALSRSVCCRS